GDGRAAPRLRAPGAPRRAVRGGMGRMPGLCVEAPARLHFGGLDLRGGLGRRFGGIGAAVPAPSLLLEARPAPSLAAEGPDAPRVLEFVRRFAAHHSVEPRVHFRVHRAIPSHAGLGSGTQLALAVARATAELTGLPTEVTALAGAGNRGLRSAAGGWFAPAQGGVFVPGETRDLVERLRAWGAAGVGQSSWGPAVYGIASDAAAAQALADRVRTVLGPGGAVYEGGFSTTGARVWRGEPSVSG